MNHNNIGSTGVHALAIAFTDNNTLKHVFAHIISYMYRTTTYATILQSASPACSVSINQYVLAILGMGYNNIKDEGAQATAIALKVNTSITDIGSNLTNQ